MQIELALDFCCFKYESMLEKLIISHKYTENCYRNK